MEWLDSIVLPQSADHLTLLRVVGALALIVVYPYLATVVGSTAISLFYRRRADRGDRLAFRFAKDVVESGTVSRSAGALLGLAPLLALVFIYAQLGKGIADGAATYLVVALLFAIAGLSLAYSYRNSVGLRRLFAEAENVGAASPDLREDARRYANEYRDVNEFSGGWGLFLTLVASYLFVAGASVLAFPEDRGSSSLLLYVFASGKIFLRYLLFLFGGLALAGSLVALRLFYWEGGKKTVEAVYTEYAKPRALKIAAFFSLTLPALVAGNLFVYPERSLTETLFALTFAALAAILLAFHSVYLGLRRLDKTGGGWAFPALVAAFAFLLVGEMTASGEATERNSALLDREYQAHFAELKGEGGGAEEANGEQIFGTVCAACHSFENKIVGPPYVETLPKYVGDKSGLKAFILNPVKVDPDYPPMPAQGLKPNEAEAVADYLLKTYESEYK
jgi:cytochrome c